MKEILLKTQKYFPEGGHCWMLGNHDYQRLKDRWTPKDFESMNYSEEFYRMIIALMATLPVALCLYQGDELGLSSARTPKPFLQIPNG